MTKVEKIEREIKSLAPEELATLRQWFLEYDAGVWDVQIQADVASGKLDSLADIALEAHRQRQTKEL